VCDLETSWMRRPWPTGGCCAKNKRTNKLPNSTARESNSVLESLAHINSVVIMYKGIGRVA